MEFNKLVKDIHDNAISKGWWDNPSSLAENIALCHSELSEALEEYRNGNDIHDLYFKCIVCGLEFSSSCNNNGKLPLSCCGKPVKPEGVTVELADCIIRILDICGYHDTDMLNVIKTKMKYNKTREYKHGNKRL